MFFRQSPSCFALGQKKQINGKSKPKLLVIWFSLFWFLILFFWHQQEVVNVWKSYSEIYIRSQKYVLYLVGAADCNVSYMLFLPKVFSLNLTRKQPDLPKLRNILQNNWPGLSLSHKKKKGLGNYSRLKETEKMWQPNVQSVVLRFWA